VGASSIKKLGVSDEIAKGVCNENGSPIGFQ